MLNREKEVARWEETDNDQDVMNTTAPGHGRAKQYDRQSLALRTTESTQCIDRYYEYHLSLLLYLS